MVFNP